MMSAFGEDYCVIVIGAAAGIGRQTALHLASQQVAVVVADRDEDGAERVALQIRESGGEARSARVDVTDSESVRTALARAIEWRGAVQGIVNSAGIQGPLGRPSHEVEIDEFERTLKVNLTAGLVIAREVIPHFLARDYGRVVHVASIAGKEGNPNMVAYSASKAGLIGMVKAQGKEYATTGVTVNAVAPAVIRTPFLDSQPAEVVEYMLQRIPMGRPGTTDEVAAMIAFAVSPACSFTTGFVFDVSGGRATY